ncbi:helicase POLQ-like [Athalia rosae]|uniref:helicase POLQ-like n=1 Tax=Athalia rosae TaxID=37344 RepID=UPI00203394D3|nr:helicase POLQ-like [Athalia rosae]
MAVRSNSGSSLTHKMNRNNSLTLGAQVTLQHNHLVGDFFGESLLSMDDSVLNGINLEEQFERHQSALSSVINDDVDYQNNNGINNVETTQEHNYTKTVDNYRTEDKFDSISSTLVRKAVEAYDELEDIFETTEISIHQNHPLNQTIADSGLEKSEWADDSLIVRAFDNLESFDYTKQTETKIHERSLLAPVNHQSSNSPKVKNLIVKDKNISYTASKNRRRTLTPNKENNSHKIPRTDFTHCGQLPDQNSFYGLPKKVKNIIEKVKGITDLYEWQDECLNLAAIHDRRNLIYALPTSGGKTLVAELLMLKEVVANKKNAIFVLPFIAIVQEKARSLAPFALELDFLIEEYAAGNGKYPPRKRRRKNTIYVCTIEKGLGLINSLIEKERLSEVGMIVIDELHLLGEDGGRGAILENLLAKVMCSKSKPHIIGMSATIGNLNDIASFLNAEVYTKDFRPVELKEYVKCEDDIWLVNLKEEEILTDLKKINYSYSEEATRLDPDKLGGLVMDIAPQDSCLIFCPTRKNCENVAMLLTKVLFRSIQEHRVKEKFILMKALSAEGMICEVLSKTIPFGVAYHHSGLMSEERRLLEEAFRSGILCVICCTSTLAAGVNLPARRVILRHPYIGHQFLNLSRYKQMIGRAGRAGMKDVGESILICKTNEIPKVKELLTSKMDDCISTMHTHEDRGINNFILSMILLNMATTRSDLHKIVEKTLLGIQQNKLDLSIKKVADNAISRLMKSGVIRVKQVTDYSDIAPNITVVTTQHNLSTAQESPRTGKRIIKINSETKLEVCKLGRAAMKGCVELSRAHLLYKDLKTAQNQLVLLDCLHLLYLVTPYDLIDQVKPSGNVYYNVVCGLSRVQMATARVLGINETVAAKLRVGMIPKNIDQRVVTRFYLTLMLNELWNQQSIHFVSTKYQVNRGIVQNLMSASASFASCVERFCEELDEFWAFRDLLHSFGKRLSHCCAAELEPLMELPAVKIGRARQLFNAGYKTLQMTALAEPMEMCEKIENMPMRIAIQIIAAAKLLLLEKVENLRDEAADVLEGIDLSSFH